MIFRKTIMFALLSVLFTIQTLQLASAMPTFARSEGVACSTCHTAWPQLNAKGRKYKENGYRFGDVSEDEGKRFADYFEDGLPIGAVVVARPYDKKKSGDVKNRALHEVEVFVAGNINKNFSGVLELEAEDETNFNIGVPWARLSYNHSPALNVNMSWASYFDADSYGFLGDSFRMTRGHVKVLDSAFGGVDGNLRAARQGFGISGRPMSKLFYNVNYSGLAGDAEGNDAKNFLGQLSYDVLDNVNIGAFAIKGKDGTTQNDFNRNGVNFMADVGATRLHGAYVRAKDDVTGTTTNVKNDALSFQVMHVFKKGKRPNWVPIMRYDTYEKNNGADSYDELTLNLTHYFKQNIKGYVEYFEQLDAPSSVTKDRRVTAQLSVGF
ncbi:MAG TPA: hypothetical protein ENJ33_05540 [Thiothrix sp.]|nr:hypothetical protein [Thiothrix sp.]